MILRSILVAGTAALIVAGPALAQTTTLTENINNTGIPRNAPALGLSSIYGLNPCSAGSSVGVTTPLFGIGGAIASIDKECETRNNAAIVITGLKDENLAREILCQIRDIRDAAIRVGKPCLPDQVLARTASAAPVNPVPVETVAKPAQAVNVPSAAIKPANALIPIRAEAPAFCRVTGLDLSLYPECTTMQPPMSPQAAVAKRPLAAVTQRTSPPGHHSVAPANKDTADVNADEVMKDHSWSETISYRPMPLTKGKAVRLIQPAVTTSADVAGVVAPAPGIKLAKLLERGAAMIAAGDIVAARLLYERAVEAGSGQAAVEMGKTYDPAFQARIKAVGMQADQATADKWYRRAVLLGEPKAANFSQVASR